jgi:hypothetical protein
MDGLLDYTWAAGKEFTFLRGHVNIATHFSICVRH